MDDEALQLLGPDWYEAYEERIAIMAESASRELRTEAALKRAALESTLRAKEEAGG